MSSLAAIIPPHLTQQTFCIIPASWPWRQQRNPVTHLDRFAIQLQQLQIGELPNGLNTRRAVSVPYVSNVVFILDGDIANSHNLGWIVFRVPIGRPKRKTYPFRCEPLGNHQKCS